MRLPARHIICLQESSELNDAALRILRKTGHAFLQFFLVQEIHKHLRKENVLFIEFRLFITQADMELIKYVFISLVWLFPERPSESLRPSLAHAGIKVLENKVRHCWISKPCQDVSSIEGWAERSIWDNVECFPMRLFISAEITQVS